MIDLKAQYGSTYRITLDPSAEMAGQTKEERLWLYRIPCRYGHIYVHGKERLGAYTNRRLMISRLLALPGMKLHQRGDSEVAVTFDPGCLEQVTQLLQAYKRWYLAPERRAAATERLRLWRESHPNTPAPDEAPAP